MDGPAFSYLYTATGPATNDGDERSRRFGLSRTIKLFRPLFPALRAIACLGFSLMVTACDSAGTGNRGTEAAVTHSRPTVPPVDAAAPAKTEAASFALG
jgi:hypothetical protein